MIVHTHTHTRTHIPTHTHKIAPMQFLYIPGIFFIFYIFNFEPKVKRKRKEWKQNESCFHYNVNTIMTSI